MAQYNIHPAALAAYIILIQPARGYDPVYHQGHGRVSKLARSNSHNSYQQKDGLNQAGSGPALKRSISVDSGLNSPVELRKKVDPLNGGIKTNEKSNKLLSARNGKTIEKMSDLKDVGDTESSKPPNIENLLKDVDVIPTLKTKKELLDLFKDINSDPEKSPTTFNSLFEGETEGETNVNALVSTNFDSLFTKETNKNKLGSVMKSMKNSAESNSTTDNEQDFVNLFPESQGHAKVVYKTLMEFMKNRNSSLEKLAQKIKNRNKLQGTVDTSSIQTNSSLEKLAQKIKNRNKLQGTVDTSSIKTNPRLDKLALDFMKNRPRRLRGTVDSGTTRHLRGTPSFEE